MLDELGAPYSAQARIGAYLCDFLVPPARLVIECDGTYWHRSKLQRAKDARRDSWLAEQGYQVLRLPETLIRDDAERCRALILHALEPSGLRR